MSNSPVFSSRTLLSIPQDGRKTRSVEGFDNRWSGAAVDSVTTGDFTEADDPFQLFALWFKDASAREINDPEAMTLATVDDTGLPDARTLLCKGADARGLVFYGNVESAKGRELSANPRAAALFHWKSLRRQARFRGPVSPLTDAEADAYFATRPRQSRIGAWASQQSRPLEIARGPGDGGRSVCEAVRRGRYPAASCLARLAPRAARDRVLAGRGVPAARSGAVPPRRRRGAVGTAQALSVRRP